jgi:hypothetical protein
MIRTNLNISQKEETDTVIKLSDTLLENNFNASNTIVISVSADYSNIVGQLLRHSLSYEGEVCDGFSIDVPYPDEVWDSTYLRELESLMSIYRYKLANKKILLVEAGVIRGSNYKFVIDYLKNNLQITQDIFTLTLYENTGSKFKSDFVGEFYDNETQDLTFWWEQYNNHWESK